MSARFDPFDMLEPYALALAHRALAGLSLDALPAPRHPGLVRALKALLARPAPAEDLAALRETILADAADLAPHVTLLERCAAALADILTGHALATDVLFPGGTMDHVEPIYRDNRWSDHFNALTAQAVGRAVAVQTAHTPGEPVRILEVGAGTGGTSAAVLARLDTLAEVAGGRVFYDYTDVSPGFVEHGKRVHGGGRPYLRGRVLNLEKDPEEQGFPAHQYDFVLGTNVIHATSRIDLSLGHIHRLLRPHGLLLLNEITRASAFATMTFGLLDGWWAFRDGECRLANAPLLSPAGWGMALAAAGFGTPAVFGWTEPAETSFQCLLIAECGEDVAQSAPRSHAAQPNATQAGSIPGPAEPQERDPADPALEALTYLTERLAGLLGLEPHELGPDRPLAEYGVDSIVAPQFVTLVNAERGVGLVPTDIFNHATLSGLAEHLVVQHSERMPPSGARSPNGAGMPSPEDGAVVGRGVSDPLNAASNPVREGRAEASGEAERGPLDRTTASGPGHAREARGTVPAQPGSARTGSVHANGAHVHAALAARGQSHASDGGARQAVQHPMAPGNGARLGRHPGRGAAAELGAEVEHVAVADDGAGREGAPSEARYQGANGRLHAWRADPPGRTGTDRPFGGDAAAVAVVGLACRFPGAPDAGAFWRTLVDGRSAVREVPAERWDWRPGGKPRYGAFLDDHDAFDPEFFNLSWREAEAMSPQQRVFLQEAWHALEDAGYGRRSLAGQRCGVFVGAAPDGYGIKDNDSLSSLGGSLAILSARISYLLDLKGPSLPLDTACSSSLVAVHLACQSLLSGDCDMALAGGVSILMTDPRLHTFLDDAGMLSPSGACHTFDAAADGFVPGEGVGVVVLKRLDRALGDGDNVVGVIKASSVNQDGRTSGITAPNGPSQTALELATWDKAGIVPANIGLVEAHGTGTQLGDPIEVNALSEAFRRHTEARGFAAIGSVKTNIGHTLTTAGVASLIKVLLALKHRTIPPSLNYTAPNPQIDFAQSPFAVPTKARPWDGPERLATVSSFGFSGTNAHMVVGEAPRGDSAAGSPLRDGESDADGPALIVLSGRTEVGLAAARAALLAHLERATPRLCDLAFTLTEGRSHFEHRLAIVVESVDALRSGTGTTYTGTVPVLPARREDAELARLIAAPKPDLDAIAACYVRGGDGDWRPLAAPGARRISLPGTAFAALRFATRPGGASGSAGTSAVAPRLHPMIADNRSDFSGIAYAIALDPAAPWLRDHTVAGEAVLPAVAYLELALAAGRLAMGDLPAHIESLTLSRPLRGADRARVELTPHGDGARLAVRSAGGLHAMASLGQAPSTPPEKVDLDTIAAALPHAFTRREIYDRFAAMGFAYGPAFQVIRALRADGDTVVAELAPAEPAHPDLTLDPALLDGAIQAAIGLMLAGGERIDKVVPVAIAGVTLHAAPGGPCRVLVRQAAAGSPPREGGTDGPDMRSLAITVFGENGQPCLTMSNVRVRVTLAPGAEAPDPGNRGVPDDGVHVFRPAEVEEPLPDLATLADVASSVELPAGVLLFDRDEALWRRLGQGAVLVRPGSAFCRLGPRAFAIDPAAEADMERLCDTLRQEDVLPRTVWHLWSHTPAEAADEDENDEDAPLRHGVRSVAMLTAALARHGLADPITIVHAFSTAPGDGKMAAFQAPVGGFAAAVARENPLVRIVSVDLCGRAGEAALPILAAETRADPPAGRVRWTPGGTRMVRRLGPASLPARAAERIALGEGAVVLITGALGGIGRLVARHLAAERRARLVLVGRSAPGSASAALIEAIAAAGGEAIYCAADVARAEDVAAVLAEAHRRFGPLEAVVHAAGITRDRFLIHKSAADFAAVLAPKVAGTVALDRATRGEPLEAFVNFSSLAGSLGNAGQSDYAAANAFLDAFAEVRTGPGRSLAIGWPYWREGGLSVDREEEARRAEATGVRALSSAEGLALFDTLLDAGEGALLLLPGEGAAIQRLIGPPHAARHVGATADPAETDAVEAAVAYLRTLLAELTAMPPERIDPDRPLEHYGIDSILVTRMNAALDGDFPSLPKTLLFEHQTLRSAATYVATHHGEALSAALDCVPDRQSDGDIGAAGAPVSNPVAPRSRQTAKSQISTGAAVAPSPAEPPVSEPRAAGPVAASAAAAGFGEAERRGTGVGDGIAIIGIAGRYPGAPDLAAFWDNLKADRDLITEVPAARFALSAGTGERPKLASGGFIDGVGDFDPLFFNIAPGEAAGIDPNERLFLEVCWEALENAGHTRASLSDDPARRVGVYAGVMYGEYQLLAAEAYAAGASRVGGASPYWSIANRVSYHFDLHGPSIAVDSACSSSLTAIHLACQALAGGECAVAIAGGVNLSLHPLKFVGLSEGHFAASDGRCHSFTAGGDGYVPGEGVGAVILKPLAAALADGDHVHAVIRGWAANHGGKTNGYTVPSPQQQGAVIGEALGRGGIDPASVSYVEAHGTGTALGDPIEVAGLTAAFGGARGEPCALGSVKANIGHLEAAAGIAGLTRVVLQLTHRTLTPTRLHGPPNPNIAFETTPFRLQTGTASWHGPAPLRGGVSSFGAGGANAHLVVEEAPPRAAGEAGAEGPALIVLSARSGRQLAAHAASMARHIAATGQSLADIARTLQIGREAMAVRLAFLAPSREVAAARLTAFAAGDVESVHTGEVEEGARPIALPATDDLEALGRAWVAGAPVEWTRSPIAGARVPLPATPLMRRHYWIERPEPRVPAVAPLHPFLDRAVPAVDGAVLVKRFSPLEPIIRDHEVRGRLLVPGVVQLEMARAAAVACGFEAAALRDVVWSAPFVVGPEGADARLTLTRAGGDLVFETVAGGDTVSRGRLDTIVLPAPGRARPALAAPGLVLGHEEIYRRLAALGLCYGPALRVLDELSVAGDNLVARLRPQPAVAGVALAPAVLDGALQSLLGFAQDGAALHVPFALAEVRLYGDLAAAHMIHATRTPAPDGVALFDLTVTDADGGCLLRARDLAARPQPITGEKAGPTRVAPAAPSVQEAATSTTRRQIASDVRVGTPGEPTVQGDPVFQSAVAIEVDRGPADAGGDEALPLAVRVPVWRAEPQRAGQGIDTAVVLAEAGVDHGLAAALLASGRRVETVGQGDPARLATACETAEMLVWVVAPPRAGDIAGEAEAQVLALLDAVRALDEAGRLDRALRIVVVTRGLQRVDPRERPDARGGAVLGLAKSLVHEYPRVAVSLVDLDPAMQTGVQDGDASGGRPSTPDEALALAADQVRSSAAALVAAVCAEPPAVPVREVAWRGGRRHVLAMDPARLPQNSPSIAAGDVVLIVGGAGGIGLEIARWLSAAHGARVALVGRRPLADVATRIATVDPGRGELRYIAADATDREAMDRVVAELRAVWGRVDVAIHAALVLRDRTLARMDEATFRAALAPKLSGSVAMAEALAREPLKVMAFLSSVNVVSGSRGQSNYVAGSSFVDAYARQLAAERAVRVLTVDWGFWSGVGVVSDEAYRVRLAAQGVHPIEPAEGVAAFAAALAGPWERLAIARAEPFALVQLGLDAPPQNSIAPGAEAPEPGAPRPGYREPTARAPEAGPPALEAAENAFAALEHYGLVALLCHLQAMLGDERRAAWTSEGLRRALGIAPRHGDLFRALLDALSRAGLIGETDGLWRLPAKAGDPHASRAALDAAQRNAPWLAGPRRLLEACLSAYPGLLRGEVDPVSVLFPGASMELVEAAYSGNPIADHFNRRLATAVRAEAERRGGPVSIVELGAGTGSTTAVVLDAMTGPVDYLVTDVSQHFLAHGERRFAGREGVRFALYDVERGPGANGLDEGAFDIAIAANVLHATANLTATLSGVRRLLRPGGLLLLSEATRAQDFGTMVFGLTSGWWLSTDRDRRIAHAPLVRAEAWPALLEAAGFGASTVLGGGAGAPHTLYAAHHTQASVAAAPSGLVSHVSPSQPAGQASAIEEHLRALLADVLKIDPEEIRLNESFDRYGLESLTALEIRNRLDRDIPGLPATLLFEHNTIARLAAWLHETHPAAVSRLAAGHAQAVPAAAPTASPQPGGVAPAPGEIAPAARDSTPAVGGQPAPAASQPSEEMPIAVIGMAGRYPGGADLDAFWRLIVAGESAITEVPPTRWDAAASFDPGGAEGTSYTKWAGFIDDIDRFDPLFFHISPLDAEVMDPQERLFLETCWHTLEHAGTTPGLLARQARQTCPEGADVGVFAGVMNVPYQWVAAEAWGAGHPNAASTSVWSIANRVSFQLDFTGPSMAVDTACSASLSAIHLAVESLRRGECGAALAGGVNLILHPRQLINLSQAHMVSRGAECRAFGEGADGFVDGEGVGAVLLKPLWAAERDGDTIHGVILGSAVNAGGRTSGYTVPSPAAQAAVVRRAIRRAGVDPASISYIETHGTGTALGDPIEIAGLAEAFAADPATPRAIGALKANIGHLESAAGVAGLTKVLLQFAHRTIAPLRAVDAPNPLIDFAATPFRLPAAPEPWTEPRTESGGGGVDAAPLRAGLSSFGAGGANAHLVLEAYPQPSPLAAVAGPDLVPLSAQDEERLRAVATRLVEAICGRDFRLADVAHTLRVGREAQAARIAIWAADLDDLEAQLRAWLAGEPGPGLLTGTGRAALRLAESEAGRGEIAALLAAADLPRLGALWVEGAAIDWSGLAVGPRRRLALPAYPFRRERYWLPVAERAADPADTPSGAEPIAAVGEGGAQDQPRASEPAVRPVPERVAQEPGVSVRLYRREWGPAPAVMRQQEGPVWVLAREAGLAESLASALGRSVHRIEPGETFAAEGADLRLDPAREGDHAALAAHLGTLGPGATLVQALEWDGSGGAGARLTLGLTKALQRAGGAPVRLIHLYAGAEERPLDQAVGALARSAMQESLACVLGTVGIAGAPSMEAAAGVLAAELTAAPEPEVVYRDGARLIPRIDPVRLEEESATIAMRIGGAYLLVGGLGEVGSALAERIGRDYRARIAVIGRSAPAGEALARLERLQRAGVQVHYEACDLTDPAALERALATIRAAFGRLHGVIHLARVVEDGLLAAKSAESVERVLAAKVAGTQELDAALAEDELDWFVLCSSLASWLGLAGGADYALACAYQNAFARRREGQVARGERSGRTVAISWPQWRHDAFLNDAKLRLLAAEGLTTIDARDGLRIITDALRCGHAEVAALKGGEEALARLPLAYTRPEPTPLDETDEAAFLAEIAELSEAELEAYLAHLGPEPFTHPEPSTDPERQHQGEAPSADVPVAAVASNPLRQMADWEEAVVDTISAFLKLPRTRFDGTTEFAAFGLDSIKALHVAERLQSRLGVPVDPAMFFEHPTVERLAAELASRAATRPAVSQ